MPRANTTVSEALKSITKQTGLRFSWDRSFDTNREITLPTTPSSFSQIMTIILSESNRTYALSDNFVLIKQPSPSTVTLPPPVATKPQVKRANPVVTVVETPPIKVQETVVAIAEPVAAQQTITRANSAVVSNADLLRGINSGRRQIMPRLALKTNLLYGALTNINLGFEVRLSNRLTLDVPVNYNPWVFSDNKRINNILVQPELRYWIAEPFNGHFFGLHGHYAHFNTGNIKAPFGLWQEWQTSRYQGDLYGVGLSYGYQWILAKRLNLEATIGFGYFYARYDRFECQNCGNIQGADLTKNYFGPTKVGVSLIYIIK